MTSDIETNWDGISICADRDWVDGSSIRVKVTRDSVIITYIPPKGHRITLSMMLNEAIKLMFVLKHIRKAIHPNEKRPTIPFIGEAQISTVKNVYATQTVELHNDDSVSIKLHKPGVKDSYAKWEMDRLQWIELLRLLEVITPTPTFNLWVEAWKRETFGGPHSTPSPPLEE